MSWWSRLVNAVCGERVSREIEEEFEAHIADAIEQGRDPGEARRAFGPSLRQRERSRDLRVAVWLDSLRADAVFGWRQLLKRKTTSAAAILSLALAIGACTAAFRLIDALLLRPLPVADPERLYALFRKSTGDDGKPRKDESYEYPVFREMRAAVQSQADLIAAGYADRTDLIYGPGHETEKAYVQNVSGIMFQSFGLQAVEGRLFSANDDLKPGAHPYAVLSYDYWTERFGQDPKVLGRTFRLGNHIYQIVGVGPERFTGTEPGTVTGIFLPLMMNDGVNHSDWSWFRVFVRLKPGASAGTVADRLRATYRVLNEERAKSFPAMSQQFINHFFHQQLVLEPAAGGVSGMQKDYREALTALGVLVVLVLLIACANLANLMTAQAAVRGREMALRVSIGAGRWRLVQLVLVESAILAFLAAALGALFAWWSAPFVVSRINPPDNPARLFLPADWRVLGFGLVLTVAVTFLFGLAPALRASSVKPAGALKGGENPPSRRRLMHALIAIQVAFCFVVHFVAGLLMVTFDRLAQQPTGFSAERILNLETVSAQPQPPAYWDQVSERLRTIPGVETVALAGWPLLSGNGSNGVISVHGRPPSANLIYFLNVSPGWMDTLKIPFIDGRDFRAGEAYPAVAIVNETFVRQYFRDENALGKWFERVEGSGGRTRIRIVGLVRDARYRNMREPITATAYVPFRSVDAAGALLPGSSGTFLVRTAAGNPLALASLLRAEVTRARPEFRVRNLRTQVEINRAQTVRERLMAMLALFFAVVALLLAGVGLYGVLDYSVLQRQREIGIRMAIGARAGDIARRVTADVFAMVLVGALAGLGLGMASARSIESLLYGVKATDAAMLGVPAAAVVIAAVLAALPAVIRAVRIDPVAMLRAE